MGTRYFAKGLAEMHKLAVTLGIAFTLGAPRSGVSAPGLSEGISSANTTLVDGVNGSQTVTQKSNVPNGPTGTAAENRGSDGQTLLAATRFNLVAYGAKADLKPANRVSVQGSLTAGSDVLSVSTEVFVPADVGKYVAFHNWTTQPFPTVPAVAQIVAFKDGRDVVLSKRAENSATALINWGSDNVPAFNACAQAAYAAGGGTCVVPAGRYLLATTPYYVVTGAQDDGSYGTPGGGEGAAITTEISDGSISGYTVVSGGHGYTANSEMQLSFSGGCTGSAQCGQAYATASTNSQGQVVRVKPLYAGFGYTTAPKVTVVPLGGDGAAAAIKVSDGSISDTKITAGGTGYRPNSTVNVFGVGGAGCLADGYVSSTAPPRTADGIAHTDVSGHVTSITWTHPGKGCTASPTLIIGDVACNAGTAASPVWTQCTNMAPLYPNRFPVQVMLTRTVSWRGESGSHSGAASLYSVWDGESVDNRQPIMFAGPIAYEDIEGLSFGAGFIGILATNNVNYSTLGKLSFNTGIGMWTNATDLGAIFDNLSFGGPVSWINGGNWTMRGDFPNEGGGFFNAESINNIIVRTQTYNQLSSKFDDWFADNFWHPEFSSNAIDFGDTPAFPQKPNPRQTSHALGMAQGANLISYRGISSLGMAILARGNRGGGSGTFDGLTVKGASRYLFYGYLSAYQASNWSCDEPCGWGAGTDPYRATAIQEGGIVFDDGGAIFTDIGWGKGKVDRLLWSVPQHGDPRNSSWNYIDASGAENPQPRQNPQWRNSIGFPYGLSVSTPNGPSGFHSIDFYGASGGPSPLPLNGKITSDTSGLKIIGPDGTTDLLDVGTRGVAAHTMLSGSSLSINGGISITGSVGNGGKLQETTSANKTRGAPVAFDAAGNTVNATAANIISLFGGGSCTGYLRSDGRCDNGGTAGSQTATNSVVGNIMLSAGNTFYDGPVVALGPGVWFLSSTVSFSAAGPSEVICKLWDGTHVASSTGFDPNSKGECSVSLSGIAKVAASASWKVSCSAKGGGLVTMLATMQTGVPNSSTLSGVKLQ